MVNHISELWTLPLKVITYRATLLKRRQNYQARSTATLCYIVSSIGGAKGKTSSDFLPWGELDERKTRSDKLAYCTPDDLRELQSALRDKQIKGMAKAVFSRALGLV